MEESSCLAEIRRQDAGATKTGRWHRVCGVRRLAGTCCDRAQSASNWARHASHTAPEQAPALKTAAASRRTPHGPRRCRRGPNGDIEPSIFAGHGMPCPYEDEATAKPSRQATGRRALTSSAAKVSSSAVRSGVTSSLSFLRTNQLPSDWMVRALRPPATR